MFCDLVGSTALSARLDPEDMREIIGAYHRCCAEQITKAGGFVAQYLGDGVLAYFGYPQAHEDDAERAVRTGLALVDAVSRLRVGHDTALQARIGIATGLAVVGDLIGDDARERGVVGETPNLAARLQTMAEPGQVVISQSTRRLIGGLFEYRDLGRVALKGLTDPVQAWQVTGASRVANRFKAQHGAALTPLVGREEELELLLRRWQRAKRGEGQVVLLSGEPGIGKSRLTVALQERLGDEPHTRLRYFCSPQHTDTALYTFHPIIAQLKRAAGFGPSDAPGVKLNKLASLLRATSGDDDHLPLVAELLSIPLGDRDHAIALSAKRKRQKTLEALLAMLEGATRRRPVLMTIEDIHWMDPSSRELLDMGIERARHLRLLLVTTFRPDFVAPWTSEAHVTTLNLGRLGQRDASALINLVAGDHSLHEETLREIVARADGIPLFVEELTKAVVEAAERDDLATTLGRSPLWATSVPPTLHASLMARLDRLGPLAKEVAQIGAAIGREFSYDMLVPLVQKRDEELEAALVRLRDAGLVFMRGAPPQAMFLFKHALVREVAYGSLLRGQRQQLHARIVTALEAQSHHMLDQQPEILAQHCTQAELKTKAITYWTQAARLSMARYATVEAAAQASKGLDVVMRRPDDAARWREELALQSALAGALNASVGASTQKTGQAYARARMLCTRLNDTATLVSVLGGLAAHHTQRCELGAARKIGEELLRLGEKENNAACQSEGHRLLGSCLYYLGELVAVREHLERALSLYVPEAHQSMISVGGFDTRERALSHLSYVLFVLGYPCQASSRAREALRWARELNNPHVLVPALAAASRLNVVRRTDAAAQEVVEEMIGIATEQRFRLWLASAQVSYGIVLARQNKPRDGLAISQKGIADGEVIGVALFRPYALGAVAQIYETQERYDEALATWDSALATVERTGERNYEAELHRFRGEWLRASRPAEHDEAEVSLRRAIAVADGQHAKMWELRASTSLARLWRDQGKRTEARDLLAPIYGWFTEGFDTPDLTVAKALLEELG
jgi:class 3 adenylate cyclase/predicted ATPase